MDLVGRGLEERCCRGDGGRLTGSCSLCVAAEWVTPGIKDSQPDGDTRRGRSAGREGRKYGDEEMSY